MALVYVGGNSAIGTGGSNVSVSLTALTGGASSSAATGDIVIAVAGAGSAGALPPAISGYTTITSQFANFTNDANVFVAYKVMGGTPDTTVTENLASGTSANGVSMAVHVWRNINATPQDVAVQTTTANGTNAPNSPAITPVTTGAIVLTIAGIAYANGTNRSLTAAPTGYSNAVISSSTAGSSNNISVGISSKAWSGSGAEDPGDWSRNGSTSGNGWAGITVALRPSSPVNSNFLMFM